MKTECELEAAMDSEKSVGLGAMQPQDSKHMVLFLKPMRLGQGTQFVDLQLLHL